MCWLALNATPEKGKPMRPCHGRLVKAHLIPRRVFLRELDPIAAVAAIDDRRSWVPACGGITGMSGHHGELDYARTLRVPFDRLPPGLLELARETGLEWYLRREYERGA